jgi:hypothetical protein
MKQATNNFSSGVFNGAIQFRCDAGDTILSNHTDTMTERTKYLSPTVQNEIIDSIRILM